MADSAVGRKQPSALQVNQEQQHQVQSTPCIRFSHSPKNTHSTGHVGEKGDLQGKPQTMH